MTYCLLHGYRIAVDCITTETSLTPLRASPSLCESALSVCVCTNHLSDVNFHALSSLCESSNFCLVVSSSCFIRLNTRLTVGSNNVARSCWLLGS